MQRVIYLVFLSLSFALTSAHAASMPLAVKKWTVMIYMNLDNGILFDADTDELTDIDESLDATIKSLEKIGSSDSVNIIIERSYVRDKYTARMYIERSTNPDKITSPLLENLGFTDMGNYLTLQDFIEWGVKNYPAQHYFVIADSHGDGWYDDRKNITRKKRWMSPDSNFNHNISSPELGKAMRNAANLISRKIDIYANDVCFMQDVETISELADSTDLIIGSEDSVDGDTFPFEKLMSFLVNSPTSTPDAVSKWFIDEMTRTYNSEAHSSERETFSVINTAYFTEFENSIRKLSDNLVNIQNPPDLQKIISVVNNTLPLSRKHNDLLDFIKILKQENLATIDKKNLDAVDKAIHKLVIYRQANPGSYIDENMKPHYRDNGGISIWLPGEYYDYYAMKNYQSLSLKFESRTKWSEAIASWSKSGPQY